MKKQSKNNTGRSLLSSILMGTVLAFVISMVLSGIVAWLVIGGKVNINASKYFTRLIMVISVFVSGSVLVNHEEKIANFGIGFVYLILMFSVNILLYSGIFYNVWLSLLMVALGAGLACLVSMRKSRSANGNRRRKKRIVQNYQRGK